MLIVNPNNRLDSPFAAVEPPLWAGLIASFAGIDLLDAEALNLSIEETVERCDSFDIYIVAMGNNPSVSSTPKMAVAEELKARLYDKHPSRHAVRIVGLHPNAINNTRKIPFQGCLPMQPWNKLDMSLYRAHNWHCLDGSPRSPYASIYTSLGCPFNCYYCNIHALYGDHKVRYRPLDEIRRELDIVTVSYGVRNIKIWDELFTLTNEHVLKVCEVFREYHERYKLNVWCYGRLSTMTWSKIQALKKAGVTWIAYGFESLKDPKCQSNPDDIIRMTKEAGISIIGNFIFGLPGTTEEDDRASVEFAKQHLFEYVNFYDAKPYPGSQWYEDVKPTISWEEYGQLYRPSTFRQQAFQEYFTNPAYLAMLERKWGPQAVNQIGEMLKWSFVPVR